MPYLHRSLRIYRAVTWCSVLLTTAVVLTPASWKGKPHMSLSSISANTFFSSTFKHAPAKFGEEGVLPTILEAKDVLRYQAILRAQKAGDWTGADALIGELKNDVLMGYVLADRYQSSKYKASATELSNWLDHYADHPQAPDIYARAMAVAPGARDALPYVKKQPALEGYGDEYAMGSASITSPYQSVWSAGLQLWRSGHKAESAKYFASISDKEGVSPWMASASAYWAYRAYTAGGNTKSADAYLHKAAEFPRSFYGILARKELKQPLGLDTTPVQLTDSDILQMVGDQTIRRIVALTEAGYNDLAEKELRLRFPQADDDEKPRLLALAHELGLASVQISMAKTLGVQGRELDFARYPIPNWQPEGGYTIDPLLLFSLMRQESGFRQTAVSPVGALGLMQLMPQTATLMHKQMYGAAPDMIRMSASEPVLNITLGQNYVGHLLTNNLVEGNLFYLLTAYNAGPGRLQEWKGNLNYRNDPLLFVESIPFNETRNYVMQVMTNYWIYSELIGGSDKSVQAVLQGQWPSYEAFGTPVAADTTVTEVPSTASVMRDHGA